MSEGTGHTGKIGALLEGIRAGKVKSLDDAVSVSGMERKSVPSALRRLQDANVVAFEKLNARAFDWESLRVVGDEPKPEKRKAKPKANPSAAPNTLPPAEEDLAQSVSVTFTRAEVVRLAVLAHELTSLVATLEASPPLGQDGAYLVRLLAKVHGG